MIEHNEQIGIQDKRQPLLADVESLARTAGAMLRDGFDRVHTVEYKGVIDPVTEMDRASENFLLAEIGRRWPGGMITSEERGLTEGNQEQSWFVDPLDGTVNYAHRIPLFSVSIACATKGLVTLGVVYDPMRDEMFSAERGLTGRRSTFRIPRNSEKACW
jgi:myo-inositol-1(or 4)-monophosphatase